MSARPTSSRSSSNYAAVNASPLRNELEALRAANAASQREAEMPTALTMDDLNEVERSAATIGVSPDSWKPISWINNQHYHSLLTSNSLGGRLVQQIESYKIVSQL